MTQVTKTRRTLKPPAYRLHKASGQARVRLNGDEVYLGKFGSPESHEKYAKLIAEYRAAPVAETSRPATIATAITINELALAFLKHSKQYYTKNEKVTDEYDCIKSALRPLVKTYGSLPVTEFGPIKLKAVRQVMVDSGRMCRTYINKSIGRIRRAFRYGVENELVTAELLGQLEAVAPLMPGRSKDVFDHPPRDCVPQDAIDKVKGIVPKRTSDILDLILLCGARPGELTMLTGEMIDRSRDVWLAELKSHKTEHHGKSRVLIFGPKAQDILKKYLPSHPSQRFFTIARSTVGNHVKDACDELKIDRFSPHWLRHNAASWLHEEYGPDIAQIMLGHATADMTQLYTHLNIERAVLVARKAG